VRFFNLVMALVFLGVMIGVSSAFWYDGNYAQGPYPMMQSDLLINGPGMSYYSYYYPYTGGFNYFAYDNSFFYYRYGGYGYYE